MLEKTSLKNLDQKDVSNERPNADITSLSTHFHRYFLQFLVYIVIFSIIYTILLKVAICLN